MKPSAWVLLFSVLVVFLCWVKGLAYVAGREYSTEPARRKTFVMTGTLLFIGLALLNLVAGRSGVFSRFEHFPPPFAIFFVFNVLVVPAAVAFSRFGNLLARHLSVRTLTAFHSFRVLAEFLILLAVHEGIAPVQMSAEGYNPDLLTGIAAIVIGVVGVGFKRRAVMLAFNLWGVFALTIIAFIAITSMPTPLRLFHNEPSNIWVTAAPYTLLPGILVSAAITAHLIYFRKYLEEKATRNPILSSL